MAGKHRLILHNQQGFTLIETLVSGIIAAIIAASVFVAFITYDRRARESVSFLKMQRQYDNVVERIAFDTRNSAKVVLTAGEGCASTGNDIMTDAITIYDENCHDTASYLISDTLYKRGSAFDAGGGVVRVAAGSAFWLPANRKAVELRLALKSMDHDTTFTLPLRKDLFQCRQ
jgi:prepilin-type N-terminal cleavage/methylation domain-containing protein